MAKAGKKRSTPDAQPPEANPHFIGRFAPTRLTVSPLYHMQHDSLGTMTPAEKRQYRYLRDKAERAGLSEAPPPSRPRGGKKIPDEDILPRLEDYVHRAEHAGVTRSEAVRRWVMTKEGTQLRGTSLKHIAARLMRKMREREKASQG
jgi:hypothetical protein